MSDTVPENWHWREEPSPTGPIVVFDIDGVISDASGRQYFLDSTSQDWDGFFDACGSDVVISDNAKLLDVIDPAYPVVLLTARPLWVQDKTIAWLESNGTRWDLLIMRDHRRPKPSAVFKVENARMLQERGYDIEVVFEDDRRNVAAYHEAGIGCVYLHSGYYD